MQTLIAFSLTLFSLFAAAVEKPFEWKEETISLPNAMRSTPYAAKLPLAKLASEEKKPAKVSIVGGSGPRWLKLGPMGDFSGVPTKEDRGEQSWKVRATSGKRKAEVSVHLLIRNREPQWKNSASTIPPLEDGQPLTRALSSEVEDADRDALTFTKLKGPDWLSLTRDGKLTLHPAKGDLGDWSAELRVEDAESAATMSLKGTVVEKNIPPRLRKPIAFEMKERETFSSTLSEFFTDDNQNDTLKFKSLASLPWITLSPEGTLVARPGFPQIGPNTLQIEVSDGTSTTRASLTIQVTRNPRPPVWTDAQSWTAQTREIFKAKVVHLAKDLDGLPLSFSKLRGPSWLTVSPNGDVSGTPEDRDEEDTKLTIRAQNDGASSDQEILLRVTKKNYPPAVLKPFALTVKERTHSELELARLGLVADRDGEPLVFSSSSSLPWLTLSAKGELRLDPTFKDIGTHRFTLTVRDRGESVEIPASISVERNPRPPEWKEIPLLNAKTREPLKLELSDYVTDLDSLPIRFSKKGGPDWIQVSEKGQVSGTPSDKDQGRHRVTIRATNDTSYAESGVVLEISKKNYPPVAAKPLELQVQEREKLEVDLNRSGAVTDLDKEDLRYSFEKNPDWVQLQENRKLLLTPQFSQIGEHKFTLRASDKEASADFLVVVKVVRNPRPPEWKDTEPLIFQTREVAKKDLGLFAIDLDKLPLTFKKVQGPPWASVSLSGVLTGTPEDKDKGTFSIEVLASNDRASSVKRFSMEVQKKNYPLKVLKPLEVSAKERERFRLSIAETKAVEDPDADALTFQSDSLPPWAALSASGKLELNPLYTHIGQHSFDVKVKDSEAEVSLPVRVNVERNPRAPVWNSEPIQLKVKARETLQLSLTSLVKDLDGVRLQFSKGEGPAWVDVDAQGNLKITPPDSDVGHTDITVVAKNDLSMAPKKARIEVLFKNHPPVWKLTEIELGKVRAGEKFGTKISGHVTDPDPKDTLAFTKVQGPPWLMVAPNGIVFGRPPLSERGSHRVVVLVSDPSRESAEVFGRIQIDAPIPRPSARVTTLKLPSAYQNELFTFNLGSVMNDKQFKYTKASGPDWLIIRSSGEAEGVPSVVGDFDFSVVVTNGRETLTVPGKGKVVPP
jgi:hypothetical protein